MKFFNKKSFGVLGAYLGRCPKCMRQSFIFMLVAVGLVFTLTMIPGNGALLIASKAAASVAAGLWLSHLTAFALRSLEVNAFFSVAVIQDEKNSSTMAVHLLQGGLGLPDRDFYFNPEPGVASTRQAYLAHMARTLELLGRDPKYEFTSDEFDGRRQAKIHRRHRY